MRKWIMTAARLSTAALLLSACHGSTTSTQSTSVAPDRPDLSGFAVVERDAGSRYIIDTKAQLCMLQIDHAIVTQVDCRALKKNVKAARQHIAWQTQDMARRPEAARTPNRRRPFPKAGRTAQQQALDAGLRKTGDHAYELDRALLDKLLGNPGALGRGARVVPSVKNGKPDGMKLYAIRPASLYARLGLSNGDNVQKINGVTITSPDKALDVYTKLKTSSKIVVELLRQRKPLTLTYTIVPPR